MKAIGYLPACCAMAVYLICGFTSFQQLEEKTDTVPLLVRVPGFAGPSPVARLSGVCVNALFFLMEPMVLLVFDWIARCSFWFVLCLSWALRLFPFEFALFRASEEWCALLIEYLSIFLSCPPCHSHPTTGGSFCSMSAFTGSVQKSCQAHGNRVDCHIDIASHFVFSWDRPIMRF